jgi:hypothetical protein
VRPTTTATAKPVPTGVGIIAAELENYPQAQQHYQTALEIYMEFGDDRNRDFVIKDLARLYQTTQDDRLLATVAQGLGATPAEVQQRFAAARA